MSTDTPETQPEQETRGGEDIDWDQAEPGQPLPEKIPAPEDITDLERATLASPDVMSAVRTAKSGSGQPHARRHSSG